MTTLIVGGTGAVGTYVVESLIECGERPVVYDSRTDFAYLRHLQGQFDFVRGDILSVPRIVEAVRRHSVTAIVNLAAFLARDEQEHPTSSFMVNAVGTQNLLEVARLLGVRRVVCNSSVAALGEPVRTADSAGKLVVREEAVMLTHGNLTRLVFQSAELADGSDHGSVLIAAPLHHIAGLGAILSATFGGRRTVLLPQFDPRQWLELVESERITHAFLVPTMLKRVMQDPAFTADRLRSLRVLTYGAAPAEWLA